MAYNSTYNSTEENDAIFWTAFERISLTDWKLENGQTGKFNKSPTPLLIDIRSYFTLHSLALIATFVNKHLNLCIAFTL